MEDHPENEPLLNKEENDDVIDIKNKECQGQTKSKEQILNKNCNFSSDCLEYIFFCCCDYDVTQKQYNNYISLKNKCMIPFKNENQNHEKKLQEFFINIKELLQNEEEKEEYIIMNDNNKNENELDNNLIKQLSKKIGFQSDNPRTDFRGGGLYSLQFMNYFITNYKIESKNILSQNSFPFSIVCINLSFKLYLILYLMEKENNASSLKSFRLKGCSRKEIKHFCEHLENDNENDLMFLILSQCLCFVFVSYMKTLENIKNNDNNIINSIINNTLECLQKTLNNIKKKEILVEKFKYELEQTKNHKKVMKSKLN